MTGARTAMLLVLATLGVTGCCFLGGHHRRLPGPEGIPPLPTRKPPPSTHMESEHEPEAEAKGR